MLNNPDHWATWRKKAERSSSREARRTVYLRALIEDYRAQAAKSEDGQSGERKDATAR
jgi:hypothetical protein